ncbi:MAG: formate dehydrogenase subunit gamma [Dehalococcoidia bacterium]
MSDTTSQDDLPPTAHSPLPARIQRFALGTRLLHWLNALLFLSLLVSGLLIYIPSVKAPAVDGYRLVPLLHIIFGVAFILAPIALVALLQRRQALVADVAQALTPETGDADWLRYASLTLLGARVRQPPTGKFNAGQKLNTWYWLLAWLALGATGAVLAVNFFTKSVFDAAFVEEIFPLHELIALISLIPLAGHLYVALVNRSTRPALSGMMGGEVDAAWAKEHHERWYEDVTRDA